MHSKAGVLLDFNRCLFAVVVITSNIARRGTIAVGSYVFQNIVSSKKG